MKSSTTTRRSSRRCEVTDPTPHEDEALDETLEETFPASDAPANTGETGIRIRTPPPSEDVDRQHEGNDG
jgi:hypothetical protein